MAREEPGRARKRTVSGRSPLLSPSSKVGRGILQAFWGAVGVYPVPVPREMVFLMQSLLDVGKALLPPLPSLLPSPPPAFLPLALLPVAGGKGPT